MSVGMTCTQIPIKKKVKYECGYDVYTNTDNKES